MRGYRFVTMEAYDPTIREKILEAVKIYWLDIYARALPMEVRRKLQALRDKAYNIPAPSEREYIQYMSSPGWMRLTSRRKGEFKGRCGACACEEPEGQPHHVHHLDYDHFMAERMADLLPLCVMCHCFIHPLGSMANEVFRDSADNRSIANSLDHLRIYRQIDGIDDLVVAYMFIAASAKSKPVDRVAANVKAFLMELAEEYSIDVLKSQLLYTWYTRGEIRHSLRQYLTFACKNNYGHDYGLELLQGLIENAKQE